MSPAAIGLGHGRAFAKKKKGTNHAPDLFGTNANSPMSMLRANSPLGMASRSAIGSGLAKRRKRRMRG
jgi:hypothetical protein